MKSRVKPVKESVEGPQRILRRKKNEATKIFKLIDLWANHECLNNTKSSAYLNKDNWSYALDKIVQAFHNTEKPPTKGQVELNFTRFRNYYWGKNNKVENKWWWLRFCLCSQVKIFWQLPIAKTQPSSLYYKKQSGRRWLIIKEVINLQ